MKRRYILLIFSVSAFVSHSFGQQSSPKAAVMSFYNFDRTHSQVFNRRNIDARKRWFSDELYDLLLNELKREVEFLKANPNDKPHFGDGLPFRPLDETCELNGRRYRRTASFEKVTVKGDLGNVDVVFKYPKACGIADLLFAVNMERQRGRWVISDIRYFPEDSSLVEELGRKEY